MLTPHPQEYLVIPLPPKKAGRNTDSQARQKQSKNTITGTCEPTLKYAQIQITRVIRGCA